MPEDVHVEVQQVEQLKTSYLYFCKEFKEVLELRYQELGFQETVQLCPVSTLSQTKVALLTCSIPTSDSPPSIKLPPVCSQICLQSLHLSGSHQCSPVGSWVRFLAEKGNEAFRGEGRLQEALVIHYHVVVLTDLEFLAIRFLKDFFSRCCCQCLKLSGPDCLLQCELAAIGSP